MTRTQLSMNTLQVNVVLEMEATVLTPSIPRPVAIVYLYSGNLYVGDLHEMSVAV